MKTQVPVRRRFTSGRAPGKPAAVSSKTAGEFFAAARSAWTERIEKALEQSLRVAAPTPVHFPEALRYTLCGGGKRFRPLLTLFAVEAAGKKPADVMAVACAIEMIHAYSLVHDDLPAMDNAETRRGKPSCHRQYGEGTAILVGDALLTLAFETLARAPIKNLSGVIRELAKEAGTHGLIGGQEMDLSAMRLAQPVSIETLTEVAERKTGALITASVVCGALAAAAPSDAVKRLEKFGRNLGLAFQLIDDLHDKDGLAKALTEEIAAQEAERHLKIAEQLLSTFGARASNLRGMVQWLREMQ